MHESTAEIRFKGLFLVKMFGFCRKERPYRGSNSSREWILLNKTGNQLINKIIVVQTAFIGDVILITPLIRAVKKLFPEASLDVMVTPQAANILDNNPHISTVILFDKRRNKVSAFFRTLTLLKKTGYDLIISPHSSFTTGLLLFLSGIPIRVGFARWTSQYFLTHRLEHLKRTLKIKKNLHLLTVFSKEEFSIQTELFPSDKMFTDADKLISSLKPDLKKVVAVAPGSNWFTKRWPKEYYRELVSQLHKQNYGIVFIGSPDERNICDELTPEDNFINLAGMLSLIESAAVISKCDLLICNDSGAMHLANAVKTDVFVFFGPTVQRIGYSPIGKHDIVFEADLDCRPCGSHGGRSCPLGHHNCMRLIDVETVQEKISEKFGKI